MGPKAIHLYTQLFHYFTGGKPDTFLLIKLADDKWITKQAGKEEERVKKQNKIKAK